MTTPKGGIPKFLLLPEDEQFEGIADPLARLVRLTMYERGIQIPDYIRALDRYHDVLYPNMTRAERNSDKSNLKDALDHSPLSFKNFVKIMTILAMGEDGIVDLGFSVTINNNDDETQSSRHDVKISSVNARRKKSARRNNKK